MAFLIVCCVLLVLVAEGMRGKPRREGGVFVVSRSPRSCRCVAFFPDVRAGGLFIDDCVPLGIGDRGFSFVHVSSPIDAAGVDSEAWVG